MSDRALTLAMVYAGWTEPNIRCELFLRHLPRRGVLRFRIAGVSPLTESLWFLLLLVLLFTFWAGVGYLISLAV